MLYAWCFAHRYCVISALNTTFGSFTRWVRNTWRHLKENDIRLFFLLFLFPLSFLPFLPRLRWTCLPRPSSSSVSASLPQKHHFRRWRPSTCYFIVFFSPLPCLWCRCPWLRGVAAVLSSPGNLPQARRHARHSQQKQRGGDLSHQHRCKETTLFF